MKKLLDYNFEYVQDLKPVLGMYLNEVSPQAENLLQDIIELKNKKPNESEYWNVRFDNLGFDDEVIFRSLFKELKESDLINATWADNIPYMLNITNKEKQSSIVINARMDRQLI